jgi:TIR domain/WD domain, G-beta repeat
MAETARQGDKLNVFISYSRDDLAFADQLRVALQGFGFGVTIDRDDITGGDAWKKRLSDLIREADTVVFVLSPSSADSPTCAWEVKEAVALGKRILPVICRALASADPPPQLAELNYMYFNPEPKFPGSGFGKGLVELASALNTDSDWLREHTRYLRLAKEWEEVGKPPDRRLLSAADIALAKASVGSRPPRAPKMTPLQLEFIKASEAEDVRQQSEKARQLREREAAIAEKEQAQEREAEVRKSEADAQKREAEQAKRVVRRTRLGLAAAVLLALAAGSLAIYAFNERDLAEVQRDLAEKATKAAKEQRDQAQLQESRALVQESRALATLSQAASNAGDQPTAMLLALYALPDPGFGGKRPQSLDAAAALDQAWMRNRETALVGHQGTVHSASFSADGTHVVTASNDNTARVWDLGGERPSFVALEGHQGPVISASFSPDGTHVVTASEDKTARVWDLRGERPSFVPLEGHQDLVRSASFSPDGTHVVTASNDKTARVWDLRGPRPTFVALEGHQDVVHSASFSADGTHVVTVSQDNTARVWDLRGERPTFVALEGHQGLVYSAAFSPDGTHVVTASEDHTARVWDLRGERPTFVALEGHQGTVHSASFSADGTHVVTASWDNTARVWRMFPNVNVLIGIVRVGLSRCLCQAERERFGLASAESASEDRNFIPPPTRDGRCPG